MIHLVLCCRSAAKSGAEHMDTWLPISIFIKHPSMPCVVFCYSLQVPLATFKIEVRSFFVFIGIVMGM